MHRLKSESPTKTFVLATMQKFIAQTVAVVLPLILRAFCTSFLNHSLLLGSIAFPGWYEDHVPFVDLPDQQIQDVYYYGLQSYKEHLCYTSTENGHTCTKFLLPVGYGGPYEGTVAAAGHHINEGRWLRDVTCGECVRHLLVLPSAMSRRTIRAVIWHPLPT